jgi:D-alanyl-D-alanine carboxypeptidase
MVQPLFPLKKEVIQILKDKKMTDLLLSKDYNKYIIDIINSKYYLSKNLDKYLSYKEKHNKSSINDVISIINVGADKNWYQDAVKADTSKDKLMLVNKFNYLTEDYEIEDLVNMSIQYAFNGKQIKKEVDEAFKVMATAASKDGMKIVANSAYRTYDYQKSIYTSYKNNKGTEYADSYAARAGYSEHQTGLAIDVSTLKSTTDDFAKTKEFQWLIDNAYKYGFILRYPKGKEYITGYNYEAWHYRYVGKEIANKIHNEGITFDEYYAYYIDGK